MFSDIFDKLGEWIFNLCICFVVSIVVGGFALVIYNEYSDARNKNAVIRSLTNIKDSQMGHFIKNKEFIDSIDKLNSAIQPDTKCVMIVKGDYFKAECTSHNRRGVIDVYSDVVVSDGK